MKSVWPDPVDDRWWTSTPTLYSSPTRLVALPLHMLVVQQVLKAAGAGATRARKHPLLLVRQGCRFDVRTGVGDGLADDADGARHAGRARRLAECRMRRDEVDGLDAAGVRQVARRKRAGREAVGGVRADRRGGGGGRVGQRRRVDAGAGRVAVKRVRSLAGRPVELG